ncbi:MAG: putative antitoxin [Thermoplasmata archaeon]|jgi:predicted CopG family antitoxin|nr:putative antitoxin [Thermoplasmata archaeon]
MARTTSFSDEAFRALRHEKGPDESDSDVLLRLLREATMHRKDPRRFLRAKAAPAFPAQSYAKARAAMRRADKRNPWTE